MKRAVKSSGGWWWRAMLLGGVGCLPVYGADLPANLQARLAPQNRVVVPEWPQATKPATTASSRDTLGEAPLVSKKKPLPGAPGGPAWALPAIPQTREAVWSPLERMKPIWNQPSVEQPSLATEERPQGPRELVLPEASRVKIATAELGSLPSGERYAREAEALPKINDDPSGLLRHGFLVRPQALAAAAPPPLLRLTIPDPDAPFRAVRIESVAAPEGETYSYPRDLPARPTLPVK
ncbi:MAG: hypothetical protein ACKOUR_14860 [Planctomycetota bacterium]